MFDMFLELLRSVHGPNLLRLKGIVKLAETPASPMVIHGVQHVLHPAVQLPAWPDGDERTRDPRHGRRSQPERQCQPGSATRRPRERPTAGRGGRPW